MFIVKFLNKISGICWLFVIILVAPIIVLAQAPPQFGFVPVPYHSQLNTNAAPLGWPLWGEPNNPNHPNNWCTVACLDMVFAFYDGYAGPPPHPAGPPFPQTEISKVANTDGATGGPWGGTYKDDARRAAHFSVLSAGLNNVGNGYSWRGLGYAAIDDDWKNQGWNMAQLKTLLDKGYPIILHVDPDSLYKYKGIEVKPCTLSSGEYPQGASPQYIACDSWSNTVLGHSVVLIGYNDQQQPVIGINPNNFVFLCPQAGPLQANQITFFNNIWGGDFLFAAPWNIFMPTCPLNVTVNSKFVVGMCAWYSSPWPIAVPKPAAPATIFPLDTAIASIAIPAGFSLPNNDPVKDIYQWINDAGDATPPQIILFFVPYPIPGRWIILVLPRILWTVKAPPAASVGNIITVDAKGVLNTCTSNSHPAPGGYIDTIGGKKSFSVNVLQIIANPSFDLKEPPYWKHSSGNGIWYSPAPPQPGVQTDIYAEVHNFSSTPVTNVTINLYCGDPTLTQCSQASGWQLIGAQTGLSIDPNDSIVVGPISFTPPPSNSFNQSYFTVFAKVVSDDPGTTGWFLEDDNVTCENYRSIDGQVGHPESLKFWVKNPLSNRYYFAVGFDRSELPSGWTTRLSPPLDSAPALIPPGENLPVTLIMTPSSGSKGSVNMMGYLIDTLGTIERITGGMIFEIATMGWAQKESMPSKKDSLSKFVKSGGAMVTVGDSVIFAFRGNKSNEFYMYNISKDTWVQKESILFGKKWSDTTKIVKKTPGKGASLTWNEDSIIYAIKGNNTNDFWAYNIDRDKWNQKAKVRVPKYLRGGSSIVYKSGKVYLLAGGHRKTDTTNFYLYNPLADTFPIGDSVKCWSILDTAPLGPNNKIWKDGSCITELDGIIYAMKGGDKPNFFYAYDTTLNTWTQKETLTTFDSLNGRLKKIYVKDGGAITSGDGVIYAIKGGGANILFKYTPGTPGVWTTLETIPRLHRSKSVPKSGAALAYANNCVWLLKGNNRKEFWRYATSTEISNIKYQKSNMNPALSTHSSLLTAMIDVMPNPFTKFTTIRYSVPVSGKVTIKLYNSTGRLVKTLLDEQLNFGTYELKLESWKLRVSKGIYFLRYDDTRDQKEIKLIIE